MEPEVVMHGIVGDQTEAYEQPGVQSSPYQMVDPELRLVPVVGLGTGAKHDAGVVNQDVDVHVPREDGASKLLHGTEALRVRLRLRTYKMQGGAKRPI